jgi:DNA-binding MarR family transcriptional regulator
MSSQESFSAALEAFFRSTRRARSRWGREGIGGLTVAQYLLVAPLADGEPRSVRALAEHSEIAAPTASRLLDALVRDGLVERNHSAEDRRCVLVGLTPAGREALRGAHAEVAARRRRVYAALEPDERAGAEQLLRRLAEIMDTR